MCSWLTIALPAEFEKAAALFCEPTREELEGYVRFNNPVDGPFFPVFYLLRYLLMYDADGCSSRSKDFLTDLVHRTTMVTDAAENV